jgi:hypothetical protein
MTRTIIAPAGGGSSGGGGTGDVVGPAASVDSEVALYSGTTGKLLKRSTGTGVTRITSGVQSAAELSGDVTTSGSNVVTIANDAVTYAKQQNVSAASRLLGRGSASGSGDCEEITLGTNLTMTGTTLAASGGGSGLTPYAQLQNFSYNTDSTEHTVWAFTVTANDLATARGLWLMLRGNLLCNSGSPTAVPRIKYGATTLWGDISPANTASANRKAWWLTLMLSNAGATNAQRMSGDMGIGVVTAGSIAGFGDLAAIGTGLSAGAAFLGTSAIDSTVNQTFALTWQWSVSNVAVELVVDQAVAFLLT